MAHVEKRGSGRWRARYRGPNNRERSRTFSRRIDAERWLTSVEHAKLSGAYIDPAMARVTFGRWAEEWLATPGKRPSAWARDESILRNHLLPTLNSRGLGTIKPNDVQALVTGWAAEARPARFAGSTTCCGPSSRQRWRPTSSPAPPAGASGCPPSLKPPAMSSTPRSWHRSPAPWAITRP